MLSCFPPFTLISRHDSFSLLRALGSSSSLYSFSKQYSDVGI